MGIIEENLLMNKFISKDMKTSMSYDKFVNILHMLYIYYNFIIQIKLVCRLNPLIMKVEGVLLSVIGLRFKPIVSHVHLMWTINSVW